MEDGGRRGLFARPSTSSVGLLGTPVSSSSSLPTHDDDEGCGLPDDNCRAKTRRALREGGMLNLVVFDPVLWSWWSVSLLIMMGSPQKFVNIVYETNPVRFEFSWALILDISHMAKSVL